MLTKGEKFEDFYKEQTDNSRIKANIVAKYFPQYAKILLRKPQHRIRYVDLFSGPGIYQDGKYSTPLLIAESCLNDSILSQKVELAFNDMIYGEDLRQKFNQLFDLSKFNFNPKFGTLVVGEDPKIDKYLNNVYSKGKNPSPTLLFFDPFGYKAINTRILGEFMKNWGNEIFLFFNIKRIHAAVENDKFDQLMMELFPNNFERLKKNRKYTLNTNERLKLIIDNIKDEFNQIIEGKIFMSSFRFMEEDNSATSHYVLHLTKHSKGYELVKQVFHEYDNIGAPLDSDGTYAFDSKRMELDEMQFSFTDENIEVLASDLFTNYQGKSINARKLFSEHQENTKYCGRHYALALRKLENNGKLISTFTDNKTHRVTVLLIEECILKFKNE